MSDHGLTEEFRVRTPHDGEWMHTAAEIRAGLADGTMRPEWPARRQKAREWSTLGELLQWIGKEEDRRAKRAKELLAQSPPSDVLCRVKQDGVEEGPFTLDQIREMWRSGKLKADSTYTFDELGDWFPIRNISTSQPGSPRKSGKQKRSPVAIALFAAGVALVVVLSVIRDSSPKAKEPSSPFDAGYVLHMTLLQEGKRRPPRELLPQLARDMYTWRIPRERGYGDAEFPEFYRGVVQAYDDHYK